MYFILISQYFWNPQGIPVTLHISLFIRISVSSHISMSLTVLNEFFLKGRHINKNLNANIFISKYYYDFNESVKYLKSDCKIANIEYDIGVDFSKNNEDCFFVDYVEQGNIETIPPEPYKDGYKFEGWYLGEEKWDFENNNVEDYFAEDKYLKLEAKWKKEE